ncbi:MAG: hypothetical protein ACTSRG_22725 [Candidatus Helarchaeota archaeon]
MNQAMDEIVSLSSSNLTSKINSSQNFEASKRANIEILPSSISLEPGETNQFFLKISNLREDTEPFKINIQNMPRVEYRT